MLNWIIRTSLKHRVVVIVLALGLIALGARSLLNLPVDAFPDTTPVQVQINVTVPALSPEEAEQQVTIPVELSLGGLPGLQNLRSISKFGLSQVVATFDDNTSIYLARQLVMERLQSVELPEGVSAPELGPISTGLGEVFHYIVKSTSTNRTLTDLREIHNWVIKPQLRQVPGVAEVNTWGGYEKQFQVVAEPQWLIKHQVTFEDLVEALQANNQNVGGGQVIRSGEALLVQGIGLVTDTDEIGDIVIAAHEGAPVRVRDVARVRIGHEIRHGAVTAAGKGEVVLGLGFMLMGENSAKVTHALKAKLAEVRKSLPEDVVVEPVYDRTELIEKVIRTVEHNLLLGALLVIAVLFAFLGNLRAGLIVAVAIPLSMLFAGNLMLQAGIAASLLSLGAIDFGIIVDGSVVMVENAMRRLGDRQHALGRALTKAERDEVLAEAPVEVARPVAFGVGIILTVFLPVLALEGIEGKMFKPMALTMIFALLGSLLLALTLVPVLCSLLLPHRVKEREPWLVHVLRRSYAPLLDFSLRHRAATLAGALVVLLATGWLAARLGGEFLPKLGEQALAISSVRLAGVSVEESVAWNNRIERALLDAFPDEIEHIWTRLGAPEVATDPMGIELSDFFIALTPRKEWKKARTQRELVEKMREILNEQPGMTTAFSQPIEMRMNEMIAGVRGDVAVKIYGDDLTVLQRVSEQVQEVLAGVEGAGEVTGEQLSGQPVLQVRVDPDAIARHGVPRQHVLNVVEAVGGRVVGEVRQGQRRFGLAILLPEERRESPEKLAQTLIPTETGAILPLGQLANIVETEGPATINREWGRRRVTVQASVQGRDVAGFVAEARAAIEENVKLPEGYAIDWGGQFENMERANRKLAFVVPLTLALILTLLYFAMGSLRDTLIVASGIPLGFVGGVLALWLRGMPLTVSAAIGFIALSGVAILNGLVLVTFIRQRIGAGDSLERAVREGCLLRLRPVLMTALVAAVGFIPMAFNVGVGGEVQRPLATVVIGGVMTNTFLTLLVLPALYMAFARDKHRQP